MKQINVMWDSVLRFHIKREKHEGAVSVGPGSWDWRVCSFFFFNVEGIRLLLRVLWKWTVMIWKKFEGLL